MSKKITDYKIRGGEQGVLYAMFEEDTRRLKTLQPNLFCIETAMGLRAEDLIKGVVKHNRFDEPSSTQRLVKIKIESVEYMK
jgi:hypothetical protein